MALDFDVCNPDAILRDNEKIWPQETNPVGPPRAHLFKALYDLAPGDIRAVIFGNDPYTRISQATGRAFEQGDLCDWRSDLDRPGRVSPSLQSILCAAAATDRRTGGYALIDQRQMIEGGNGRRQPVWFCHVELRRAIDDRAVVLPAPRAIFAHWTSQGVLWLNRTLTYTRWVDDAQEDTHRSSHQKVWAPFTSRMVKVIAEQARERPIVIVLWGSSADDLLEQIQAVGKQLGVPDGNIRVAATGHPQWPEGYFRVGNPLTLVNHAIGDSGTAIDWCGPQGGDA